MGWISLSRGTKTKIDICENEREKKFEVEVKVHA